MSWATRVQVGVYNRLIASSTLNALLPRHNKLDRMALYDHVPQPDDSGDNALFPLVTIGEDALTEWGTDTASGTDATVSIHVWSRAGGWKEAKAIAGAIYAVLNRAEFSIPSGELVGCDWMGDRHLRDSDGETQHIVSAYRVLVDE